MLGILIVGFCIFFWFGPTSSFLPLNPENVCEKIINCKNGYDSIKNNKQSIEDLKKQIQDKEAEKNRKSGQNYPTREYEEVKWVGLEETQPKILRIVGAPPSSMTGGRPTQPTDAQEIWFSTIKDDSGKRMQLKLPPKGEDLQHSHIMWRIINAVKEVEWIKNPKPGEEKKKLTEEKNSSSPLMSYTMLTKRSLRLSPVGE